MSLANQITLFRIFLTPLIAIALLLPELPYNNWVAAVLFLVVAFSDYFDGYFARKLNQVSDFGKVFDPLSDKILVIVILISLVDIKAISALPVIIIVMREFIITGVRIMAGSLGNIIAANLGGKWKTVLQDAAVLMLILNIPYAALVLWAAVAVSVTSGYEYVIKFMEASHG